MSVVVLPLVLVAAAIILWRLLGYLHLHSASSPLRRLPGPPKESFFVGNMRQYLARDGSDFQRHVALDYGPVVKLSGYLGRPLLYISDPKALHNVLIKQEAVFQEAETFSIINLKIFGPGLLSTLGHQHGKQRKLMNPVFSVNHMRHMLPIFYSVCNKLQIAIASRLENGPREIDVMYWMGRAALEIVGQAGLGHSFDPLVEGREDQYGEAVKSLVPNLNPLLHYRWLVVLAHRAKLPSWLQRAVLRAFPAESAIRKCMAVVETLDKSSRSIYNMKKRAYEQGDAKTVEQIGIGKDIISILIRANAQTAENERLSEEEVIAQLTTLVFAAMDTSSNTLARTFHLLSQHPDVQSKLRRELLDARASEGLSYEELNKLPLLDCVCRETLRLYPVAVSNRFRVAVTDSVLPLSEPVSLSDGEIVSELHIPAGTDVMIGILGSNLNKSLWGSNSEEWKPERWLSPPSPALSNARIPGVYSNLLTFIGGKRACIGFKFAEMEIKVVLAALISRFTFEQSDKPIIWNNSTLTFPSVADDKDKPSLPLKVALCKAD